MSAPRVVCVDGSNVAYPRPADAGGSSSGRPTVANLISVCSVLLGWGARPVVLADASLPHVIDDPHTLQRLIDLGLVSLISDRPMRTSNCWSEPNAIVPLFSATTGSTTIFSDIHGRGRVAWIAVYEMESSSWKHRSSRYSSKCTRHRRAP